MYIKNKNVYKISFFKKYPHHTQTTPTIRNMFL
jgi:hypothetical protein